MYEFGREIDPEVVIFPLRGAHPFSVAYRKISELNQKPTPDFLLLPLGTFIDIHTKNESGLTKPEKIEVVQIGLQNYFAEHPEARKVLLIDEVMNGGTILTHHRLLDNYLKENVPGAKLNVCAIEHGQHEQRGKYRNRVKIHNFHTVRVESLFIMDREQYLPRVKRNSDFSIEIEEGKLEEILEQIERMY